MHSDAANQPKETAISAAETDLMNVLNEMEPEDSNALTSFTGTASVNHNCDINPLFECRWEITDTEGNTVAPSGSMQPRFPPLW